MAVAYNIYRGRVATCPECGQKVDLMAPLGRGDIKWVAKCTEHGDLSEILLIRGNKDQSDE